MWKGINRIDEQFLTKELAETYRAGLVNADNYQIATNTVHTTPIEHFHYVVWFHETSQPRVLNAWSDHFERGVLVDETGRVCVHVTEMNPSAALCAASNELSRFLVGSSEFTIKRDFRTFNAVLVFSTETGRVAWREVNPQPFRRFACQITHDGFVRVEEVPHTMEDTLYMNPSPLLTLHVIAVDEYHARDKISEEITQMRYRPVRVFSLPDSDGEVAEMSFSYDRGRLVIERPEGTIEAIGLTWEGSSPETPEW